ncbi:MAG: FHA domain-containing protein [Acidobacteria bacterium]|nr:FHA domain-containing protein [Acidobacteriota bacterium]
MRITLVEVGEAQPPDERTFEQPLIRVGRDAEQCHLVFNQAEWPMVSRRHAEFRVEGGRCLLVDTDSTFGTFLDGRRVLEATEIQAGSCVQLGTRGPLLRVCFEGDCGASSSGGKPEGFGARPGDADADAAREARDFAAPPTRPHDQLSAQTPSRPPADCAVLEFEDGEGDRPRRVRLDAERMLIGRDPASDIPISAAAAVVSRRHAEIRRAAGGFTLADLDSFNGTLLNGRRITGPTPLADGDRIQLGMGGPVLCLQDPSRPTSPAAPPTNPLAHPAPAATRKPSALTSLDPDTYTDVINIQQTIVDLGGDHFIPQSPLSAAAHTHLLTQHAFNGESQISVGRAPGNDIRLDGLQISNYHARFVKGLDGLFVEDAGSTNGVYVNGARLKVRAPVRGQDIVQIGPFVLKADPERGVEVFDTRSETRIDAYHIVRDVPSRAGRGTVRLLHDISLTVRPNEFVGILGSSGAGKSLLIDALNGMRPPTGGRVFVNNLDYYQHLESLKHSVGYVPQDDIIHRELTVYRTLFYVARLRLSRDVAPHELDQIVCEVMDVTGLSERRDVPVAQLSGGQRKRVSIAVELITKPSVIFLDEPTSGLDPATEEKIMKLFRQIVKSGRTVVLTTHAMENVRLFDKVAILMRGRLIFYGAPGEALAHVGADSFKDLYDKLEASVTDGQAHTPPPTAKATAAEKRAREGAREKVAEAAAEEWRLRFQATELYRRNIAEPLGETDHVAPARPVARRRSTVTDAARQWVTLVGRYGEVFGRDRVNLLILLGQAPIIALFTYLVVGEKAPRDFPYFVLALSAIWFGTSVAAREIVKERAIYRRERMVNLRLLPYVGSKLFVLSLVVGLQCVLLFGTLALLPIRLPGPGILQVLLMILTGIVGIAVGLYVSAMVKSSEMATSLVPLILIPQILFSGLVGVPEGVAKYAGLTMPATWSFDELKRLSGLDTLNEEGSTPGGPNEGRGLLEYTKRRNREELEDAQKDADEYRQKATESLKEYGRKMERYLVEARTNPNLAAPEPPALDPAPRVPDVKTIGDDLRDYVSFKHPNGHILLNPLILLLMFWCFFGATAVALRVQDTR